MIWHFFYCQENQSSPLQWGHCCCNNRVFIGRCGVLTPCHTHPIVSYLLTADRAVCRLKLPLCGRQLTHLLSESSISSCNFFSASGSFAWLICWALHSIIRRTKRDNLILVLNRPIIPKNNQ